MDLLVEKEGPLIKVENESLKYGITGGVIGLLLMYGSWTMGIETFTSVQIFSKFVPYMIIILLIAGFQLRKKKGGFLPFSEGLKFTFLAYVIAAVIMGIGTYILYNLIDKDLTQKSMIAAMDKTKTFMEKMGSSKEDIQKAMASTETKGQSTGIGQILMGLGIGLIWDFVMSLLITICIKKEEKFDM